MNKKIKASANPYAQEIRVDTLGQYVNISQDRDMICVGEQQWEAFLAAVIEAAKEKGWLHE